MGSGGAGGRGANYRAWGKPLTVQPAYGPRRLRPSRFVQLLLLGLIASATVYLLVGWFYWERQIRWVSEEWGPLEILHTLLTALCTWLFYRAWREGEGAVRVAGGALAMLSAACFVRELDVKKTSAITGPEWLYFLADHGLQEFLLVAMTLPIFVYLYRQREHAVGCIRLGLRLGAWPLYAAGIFLLAGAYFDDTIVTTPQMRFWEEMIETYGFLFLALAAWQHLHLVGDETLERAA